MSDWVDDGRAGFTLVETIIAFVVLSLALTVAVRTISVSVHNAQRARAEMEMRVIARAILLESLPRRVGTDQGQWDVDHSWTLTIEQLSQISASPINRISLRISRESAPRLSVTYLSFESGSRH